MTATYPGLLGFREVAGLPTTDGRRVRPGLLFRSGTPQFLTVDTARRLHTATGIRTVVDLRLPHEVDREGSGPLADLPVRQVRAPFQIRKLVAPDSAVAPMDPQDPFVNTYLGYLENDPAAVGAVIAELARPDALPALIHCTVGRDRTGVAVALLLDAIGVRRDAIAADYAAGEAEVAPAMERLRGMASYGDAVDVYPPEAWHAPPDAAVRFLAEVDSRFGGVRALLARHGVDDRTLAVLTSRLIEETDEQGGRTVKISESIIIAATSDAVWRIGGDVARVADWVPAIEKSHLDGDIRHATFAGDGGNATERIVERDDAARFYVYEYLTGPLPLTFYRSRFEVREHADGAEVVWSAEFGAGPREEEAGLAEAIGGIYRAGLEELARQAVGAR